MSDPNDKRTDKNPGAPRGLLVGEGWPSCRYSPDGEARVFQKAEDVPDGWEDHPNKFKDAEATLARATKAESLAAREERLRAAEADLKAREQAFAAQVAEAAKPDPTPVAPKPFHPKPEVAKPAKGPRPVLKIKNAPKVAAVETRPTEPEPMVVLGDDDDNEDDGE